MKKLSLLLVMLASSFPYQVKVAGHVELYDRVDLIPLGGLVSFL